MYRKSKVDTVSKEQLEKVKAIIRILQSKAVMFETNYSQIDVDEILNTKQKTVRKKKHPWIGDLIFYILLFGMVIGALILKDIHKDIPKSIAGISIFTVLTSSMENEIPKGSLVVAKYMEPSELKIGDDITFMISETTTITHRIIGIVENYEQTGQRAFETKGTMNKDKDKLPVPAVNVIGKVVYHNYTLGRITDFISQNIIIILVMVVLIWVLSYVLKSIFKKI
jgi:signal peptidase